MNKLSFFLIKIFVLKKNIYRKIREPKISSKNKILLFKSIMLHFKTHFKTFLTLYLKKKEIKKAVIQGLNLRRRLYE